VPEWYETTRTCYKSETVQEKYTTYKYENATEKRTRTVYKQVPTTCEVEKTICKMVPCVEERTVYEKVAVCKPCTYTVRKCVDKGHWECKEVPCGPSFMEKLSSSVQAQLRLRQLVRLVLLRPDLLRAVLLPHQDGARVVRQQGLVRRDLHQDGQELRVRGQEVQRDGVQADL